MAARHGVVEYNSVTIRDCFLSIDLALTLTVVLGAIPGISNNVFRSLFGPVVALEISTNMRFWVHVYQGVHEECKDEMPERN